MRGNATVWALLTAVVWIGCGGSAPPPDPPIVVDIETEPAEPGVNVVEGEAIAEPDRAADVRQPRWAKWALHEEPGARSRATRVTKEDAKDAYRAGLRHLKAGRCDDAIPEFVLADRLYPAPTVKFRIAECMDKLGRHREAVIAYRWYLATNPHQKHKQRIETAERRIAELAPPTSVAAPALAPAPAASPPPAATMVRAKELFVRGMKSYQAGKYTEAKKAFEASHRLSQKSALLYNIAMVELKLGNKKAACATFARYQAEAGQRKRSGGPFSSCP